MKENNSLSKVSIILPVYNGAKYLRGAIDSCLHQTYSNLELIIVDDCSTDETPQIIKSYEDPRIRHVRNQANQRLPRSLNAGFAQATGAYLTWTSDDNQFMPDAIETMLAYLKEHPAVDFVYADNLSKYLDTGETTQRNISGPADIKERNCIGACYLFTRKVYETIGGFNPNYELVEDYEYWVRVWKKFKMRYLPKTLYIYGEHHKSLTNNRMLSIQLFDKIMKYRHGFITMRTFMHAVSKFLTVAIDSRESVHQLVTFWLKTAKPIFRISMPIGIFFVLATFYALTQKAVLFTIKRALWPFRVTAVKRKVRKMARTLKTERGKVNILCAIPGMTIGGSQKVVLTIAAGLRHQENLCFHLVAAKKTDQRLENVFKREFRNTVVIDQLPDEKLYTLYFRAIVETLNIDILLISHSAIAYQCVRDLRSQFKALKVIDILHLERVGATRNEMLWVNPYMDKRVCISWGLRKHMIAKVGSSNGNMNRFTTIYNGIDFRHYNEGRLSKGRFKTEYGIPSETKLITFAARFADEKNPLVFVEIAKKIIAAAPKTPIQFVMAGDGYLFNDVQRKIEEHGIADHILLTGMLDNIRDVLSDTHIFVVVASNEGIPLTVMEAIAMNIPVVSTIVGATDEVLKDGVNGYLIAPGAEMADCFAEKLTRILNDDDLYASLAMSSKEEFYEKFSRENMCTHYKRVFDELMGGRLKGHEQTIANSVHHK